MKRKKTLNQLEYEKALRNLKRRIKRAEHRGYYFSYTDLIPEKPKRVTKKAIQKIKDLNIYSKAEYLDPETGKIVSGELGRKIERTKAAKKAAKTRLERKRITEKPITEKIQYIPSYSAIESIKERLSELDSNDSYRYLNRRIDDNVKSELEQILNNTIDEAKRYGKLFELEQYYEEYADEINKCFDVIIYASSQEQEVEYNQSFARLIVLLKGGITPSIDEIKIIEGNDDEK